MKRAPITPFDTLSGLAPEDIAPLSREEARRRIVNINDVRGAILRQPGKPFGRDGARMLDLVHKRLSGGTALAPVEKLESLLFRMMLSEDRAYSPAEQQAVGDLEELEARMIQLMLSTQGVGVSLVQVGLPLRGFVMGTTHFPRLAPFAPRLMINPYLLEHEGSQTGLEACLSIPDKRGEVTRACRGTVAWQDIHGETHTEKLGGFLFRIWQHEYGHTNGRLIIDHIIQDGGAYMSERDYVRLRDHGIAPDYWQTRLNRDDLPDHIL